ncbi:MAG TPA: DUF4159 domain-containing protein [Bryobacteraceae bacterium]|nr:DUF4159 domain-containing protein [Bryobacteraceae bacterium]
MKTGIEMRYRTPLIAIGAVTVLLGTALAWESQPKPFREYPGREYEDFPLPPDYAEKTEWVFARLMYPQYAGTLNGRGFRRFGGWGGGDAYKQGRSSWTTDYPRADRHLSMALRRLTRVHVRSVEQPVDLDDQDDVYNYPWLYAVEVGHWALTDEQAKKMRDYLDRGGFFMCDDFHGTQEWAVFVESMHKVFPDREIVDLPKEEPIFHTIYDLDDKYQVPGAQYLRSHRTYEYDGYDPHWRGIYDDRGRVVVAICNDMDLGDSWEWADDPKYDEKFSAMGFRIAANYLVYSMTH